MVKRSQKRLIRRQDSKTGCMSGLIRIFYSRHDAKLLLDRKQGSRRHTFSGFPARGHSRKNSRDLDEIDEDGVKRFGSSFGLLFVSGGIALWSCINLQKNRSAGKKDGNS